MLYQGQGRFHEALAVAEQLCTIEPAKPEHWFQVAVLRGWQRDFEGALTAAERAIALDPHNARYQQVREVIRSGQNQ
jgi:tetratricopeptide (TPR) repeat protein